MSTADGATAPVKPNNDHLAHITLRKNEERRLKAGHVWVYSNEIDTKETPLNTFEAGQQVMVKDSKGKAVGVGYINPQSLIAARIMTRDSSCVIGESLLTHRLKIALSLREKCFDDQCYRWVYGDSDGLPGLVVDRFGDYVVVQLNTAGMDVLRDEVVAAITKVVSPAGILFRNDSPARNQEGLPSSVEVAAGEWPDELMLTENGVKFVIPGNEGQKTGWFYDHRENRQYMKRWVEGKRVLDVFSYVGGWGVQAAVSGAEAVLCVDASELALDYVEKNAVLNDVAEKVGTMQGNAFDCLKQLAEEKEKFDVIVIDPPAFIKRKKDFKNGSTAYRKLNELAMRLLSRDGLLVSASCSMHMPDDALLDIVRGAGRHVDRQVQIVHQGSQGADHPVHPSIVETHYLKAIFARVLPSF
ncbi:rRNA large subunit methyltransferase I [Gammaproteobacteria bacterium 45_16_T64]|nr:rRNA large subunit methyltransferase I [Gammaproteobacteria bacterium 45_16_T64]